MQDRMSKVQIQELSDRAMEHVKSVSYRVGLRWVFYRLLQDGFYSKKDDWQKFKGQCSAWRHEGRGDWRPDTLEDDTREVIYRGTEEAWPIKYIPDFLINYIPDLLKDSHFKYQDYYVEVWFEARAMKEQFQRYTPPVPLRPFGGDYTIGPKWNAAKDLEKMSDRFGKPIKILYFGDRDSKGDLICYSAIDGPKGMRKWCAADFEVIRCGLNTDQIEMFRDRGEEIPENPEKPGQYQWEALTDDQAREIIEAMVDKYIDSEAVERVEEEAREQAKELAEKIREAFEE